MPSKRCHSFSLIFLAVAILILTQTSEARYRSVNPFCMTADYRLLCTTMVHGAVNWHDAVANAIKASLDLATKMQSKVHELEPALTNLPPQSKDSTIQTCSENFDSAADNLKQALDSLEAGDKGSLDSYLSAVTTSDCTDAFKQFNVGIPDSVARITSLLDREISNCLAVSQQN